MSKNGEIFQPTKWNFQPEEQFEQNKAQRKSILKWQDLYHIETTEQITTKLERAATVISLVDEDGMSFRHSPPVLSKKI